MATESRYQCVGCSMAYHWKNISLLLIIFLGTLLIATVHRKLYITDNDARIPSLPNRVHITSQRHENILKSELNVKDQELKKKTEKIAELQESIAKLQTERDAVSTRKASATQSSPLYDCNKGLVLPLKSEIKTMKHSSLADLYHSYVENIQVTCGHMRRMGSQGDGGWEVCDDDTVRPKQPCLVYSVGINNDFTFDDAVGRQYGCEIHAFDPSMKKEDHQRSNYVMFHNLGLADFDGLSSKQWKMATLNTIRNELGHTKKSIDILKIDIEEWEIKVFPEMLKTGALQNVTQFVFEMHMSLKLLDGTKERYRTALEILRDLYDLGFRIFFTHRNRFSYYMSSLARAQRTACHEINMIKVC